LFQVYIDINLPKFATLFNPTLRQYLPAIFVKVTIIFNHVHYYYTLPRLSYRSYQMVF